MWAKFYIALYTVLAADGEILLLPVHSTILKTRKQGRQRSSILIWQIGPTLKATTFVSVKCVACIITFIFAAVTAVFPTYKSLYRPATKNHN